MSDSLSLKQVLLEEIAASKSGSLRRSVIDVESVTSQEKVKSWIDSQNIESQKPRQFKEIAIQTEETVLPERAVHFEPSTEMLDGMMNSTLKFSSRKSNNRDHYMPVPRPMTMINSSSNTESQTQFKTFNIHSSTKNAAPTVNSNFEEINTRGSNNMVSRTLFLKHNLTKEEIAARHVVKELPKFDGSPRLWAKFISCFHRSTEVCGFTDLENLERLANSLTGKAFTAVESSLTMEENLPRILETLEMLFGKPEFIIHSLIDELKRSPLPSADNIDSIIRYSLDVENISVTMKVAKLSDHLWNPILLSDMVDRLPNTLKLEWATHKFNNPNSNIEVFGMWLKQKAMTYSTILVKPPNISSSEKSNKGKYSIHVHQESKIHMCFFCSGKCSKLEDCMKFNELNLHEKWNFIRKNFVCRICLTKHKSKMCSKDDICGIDGCQYRHHYMLHKKVEPSEPVVLQEDVNIHTNGNKTYFKILPVLLKNGNKTIKVFAMLDDGSSITLIDDSVANALELEGETQPLCLRWTKGIERTDNNSKVVTVNISQSAKSESFIMSDVHTIQNLSLPSQTVDMEYLCDSYEHLKGVPIKSFENAQPLLLIGLKHAKFTAVQKYRFGKDNQPTAAKTVLGWCIFGTNSSESREVFHINHCDCKFNVDKRLEDIVISNYSLEAIGVSSPNSTARSNDDIKAMNILETTTKFNGRQYEVGLLWKYDNIDIPNNLQLAVRRHKCLEKRFSSEPELRQVINDQVQDYIKKGYARKLEKTELKTPSWYLPIFVVRNPNKPNKIRLVWDAAAEFQGVSLNKMLLKGPDLLVSLPGVLLRFREHKIALTGDIKEMFHQIVIREEDRKYQRFIWKPSHKDELEVYEMTVMTFGASCSPSCSQYIKNLNAEKFCENFKNATRAIKKNHYVDDWLESVDTSEEAIKLAEEVRYVHYQGGFTMRNWISNDSVASQHLNNAKSTEMKNLEIGSNLNVDKILGMFWRTSNDVFTYTLKVRDSNAAIFGGLKIPTKREFLRILMSFFDPLGLIANVMIYPKILLQRIWRSKTN